MPYATTAELPDRVKRALGGNPRKLRQWMHVFNSAHQRCVDNGGSPDQCEQSAFAQANGVVKADDPFWVEEA